MRYFPAGEDFLMLPAGGNWAGGGVSAENAGGGGPPVFFVLARLQTELRKERRLLNVGARLVPFINVTNAGGDFVPFGILLREIAIQFTKHFRLERGLHLVAHFLKRGPDVFEENVLTIRAFAER